VSVLCKCQVGRAKSTARFKIMLHAQTPSSIQSINRVRIATNFSAQKKHPLPKGCTWLRNRIFGKKRKTNKKHYRVRHTLTISLFVGGAPTSSCRMKTAPFFGNKPLLGRRKNNLSNATTTSRLYLHDGRPQ